MTYVLTITKHIDAYTMSMKNQIILIKIDDESQIQS